MKLSRRFLLGLIGLFGLVATATAPRAARFHCESDECGGLVCKDSGSAETNCSISPGGSCVTSKCAET